MAGFDTVMQKSQSVSRIILKNGNTNYADSNDIPVVGVARGLQEPVIFANAAGFGTFSAVVNSVSAGWNANVTITARPNTSLLTSCKLTVGIMGKNKYIYDSTAEFTCTGNASWTKNMEYHTGNIFNSEYKLYISISNLILKEIDCKGNKLICDDPSYTNMIGSSSFTSPASTGYMNHCGAATSIGNESHIRWVQPDIEPGRYSTHQTLYEKILKYVPAGTSRECWSIPLPGCKWNESKAAYERILGYSEYIGRGLYYTIQSGHFKKVTSYAGSGSQGHVEIESIDGEIFTVYNLSSSPGNDPSILLPVGIHFI